MKFAKKWLAVSLIVSLLLNAVVFVFLGSLALGSQSYVCDYSEFYLPKMVQHIKSMNMFDGKFNFENMRMDFESAKDEILLLLNAKTDLLMKIEMIKEIMRDVEDAFYKYSLLKVDFQNNDCRLEIVDFVNNILITEIYDNRLTTRTAILARNYNSIIELQARALEVFPLEMCKMLTSPQMAIFNLYLRILRSFLMSLRVFRFCHWVRNVCLNSSNVPADVSMDAMIEEKAIFANRLISLKNQCVQLFIKDEPLSRMIWKCDPSLLILKQANRNSVVANKCFSQVEALKKIILPGCNSNNNISDCQSGLISTCHSIDGYESCTNQKGLAFLRIFEYNFWLFNPREKIYGNQDDCNSPILKGEENSCLCTCSYKSNSSMFNLYPALTDVKDNMVLTGLRLVHENNVYSIKIQQGILEPYGTIKEGSVHWKNVSYPPEGERESFLHPIAIDSSKVFLDDLEVSENNLLTGISFHSVKSPYKSNERALSLRVRSSRFSFPRGNINLLHSSEWITNENFDRKELEFDNNFRPLTYWNVRSDPDSAGGEFVRFRTSDLMDDVGQSTVPYLDLQEVESIPHYPLSGAGIYHKGTENSAGFLGLKLITYNIEPHVLQIIHYHRKHFIKLLNKTFE